MQIKKVLENNLGLLLYGIISLAAYIFLGYVADRKDTIEVWWAFAILFGLYFLLLRHSISTERIRIFIYLGILFRLSLFFQVPNLSDDFYRFIFDGEMVRHGINPYTVIPSAFMANSNNAAIIAPLLFGNLNSPNFHTVYPPVLQGVFAITTYLAKGNIYYAVLILHCFILIAEVVSIWLMVKILRHMNLPSERILLYVLNPLIVVELSGNLHFEALVICLLLLTIWFLIVSRTALSALFLGLAIGTKLIPLLLIPAIAKKLGFKQGLYFTSIALAVPIVLFLPFVDKAFIEGILSGLSLFFQLMEFNAGIFYLIRNTVYHQLHIDIRAQTVLFLSCCAIVSILAISLRSYRQNISEVCTRMILSLFVYYLCSMSVHPWYIALLIMLNVIIGYPFKFVSLWSCCIIASYIAYQKGSSTQATEYFVGVAIEYVVVISMAIYELIVKNRVIRFRDEQGIFWVKGANNR